MWTYEEFCANILILDNSIRFVGIADQHGRIFATAYRPGLDPFLTKEAEESIKDAVIGFRINPSLQNKIGSIVYASTIYEKMKRATIRFQKEEILVITFDLDVNHELVLNDRVLPLLRDKLVFSRSEIVIVVK